MIDEESGLDRQVVPAEINRVDADNADEAEWVEQVNDFYKGVLLRTAKSFFTGYNSNVEGHEYGKIRHNIYNGGVPRYANILSEMRDNDYEGVNFK